jgi:hypothetical protein
MNNDRLRQSIQAALENRQAHQAIEIMCENATARHLVWWGCLCAWSKWRPQPPVGEDTALGIASRWVLLGGDEHRRDAASALQSEGVGKCRQLLSAVVNSGGELNLEPASFAHPTPDLTKRFLFGFVHTLISDAGPVRQYELADEYAQIAIQMLASPPPDSQPTAVPIACVQPITPAFLPVSSL